jgi:hypothetical protein
MKITINYPVNGCDLNLSIDGEVHGLSRDEYNLEVFKITAKYGDVEVFSYDGEEHGLLADSEMSEEIILVSETLLVEEKFENDGYFDKN